METLGLPVTLWLKRHEPLISFVYACSEKESLRSSADSDLEAFSHNPTDGSFAPLANQPSANANCLNLRFLSY